MKKLIKAILIIISTILSAMAMSLIFKEQIYPHRYIGVVDNRGQAKVTVLEKIIMLLAVVFWLVGLTLSVLEWAGVR